MAPRRRADRCGSGGSDRFLCLVRAFGAAKRALHRVQVEAFGFLPQTRIVVFDKDVSLDVALSRKLKEAGTAEPAGMKPDPYK